MRWEISGLETRLKRETIREVCMNALAVTVVSGKKRGHAPVTRFRTISIEFIVEIAHSAGSWILISKYYCEGECLSMKVSCSG